MYPLEVDFIVSNRTVAFSFRFIFRLLTYALTTLQPPSSPSSRSFSRIRSAEYGASSSYSSTRCLYGSIFVGFGSLNVYSLQFSAGRLVFFSMAATIIQSGFTCPLKTKCPLVF